MLVLRYAIPFIITWAMPCKIYLQANSDSESLDQPAKSVQSDQVLPCLQTESLNNTECMNEEQRPTRYFVHAQDDLNFAHVRRHFFAWHGQTEAYEIYFFSYTTDVTYYHCVWSLPWL